MRIVQFTADRAAPVSTYESVGASAVALGHGRGEIHVNAVHLEAGSSIGAHPTGYCQLFLVVQGRGWVAAADGSRVEIETGQGAFFGNGEVHSKGSETGMLAVMVQGTDIEATTESL